MKTLGIIGGIAPESTIDYYRTIVALTRERAGVYPHLIINSIDLPRLLDLADAKKLDELTNWLGEELERLARAGAELAILASNTPHIVFGELQAVSPIPLVSIVRAALDAAAPFQRVAMFGTRFTMQGSAYPPAIIRPSAEEQDVVHEKYMSELVNGRFLPETRALLESIIDRMKCDHAIDALLLAGTELPLLLRGEEHNGVRLLDTGRIHAAAAVVEML